MALDPDLAREYIKFMTDYESLGHMRELSPSEVRGTAAAIHYIPHHGIRQRGDQGEKLRVPVTWTFNASYGALRPMSPHATISC